jgi:hypothetical protein
VRRFGKRWDLQAKLSIPAALDCAQWPFYTVSCAGPAMLITVSACSTTLEEGAIKGLHNGCRERLPTLRIESEELNEGIGLGNTHRRNEIKEYKIARTRGASTVTNSADR